MSQAASLEELLPGVFILYSPFVFSKRGLIIDESGSTLIDTSVSLMETKMMFDKADEAGYPVRRMVLTHAHFDHTVGCQLLPDGERIAQKGTTDWMLSDYAADYLAIEPPEHLDMHRFEITPPTVEIDGSAVVHLASRTLEMFPTPGHSPESMSVLLQPDGLLFTGDAVVTSFPPVIGDGDSQQTIESLEMILTLDFERLIPGHGDLLDYEAAQAHCRQSIDYLREVRRQIDLIHEPSYPLEEIQQALADLTSVFPPTMPIIDDMHRSVVNKVWDERRREIMGQSRRQVR